MNIILFLAFLAAMYFLVIKKNARTSKNVAWYIIAGGLIFGIGGLLLGISGAIILAPGNNLAPIIGVLFTGPIGFITGLIAGYFYWKKKVFPKKENL